MKPLCFILSSHLIFGCYSISHNNKMCGEQDMNLIQNIREGKRTVEMAIGEEA